MATQTVGIGNILTNMDAAFHHSYHSAPSAPPDCTASLANNGTLPPSTFSVGTDKSGGNNRTTTTAIESSEGSETVVVASNRTHASINPSNQQQPPSYQSAIIGGNNNCITTGSSGGSGGVPGSPTATRNTGSSGIHHQPDQLEKQAIAVRKGGYDGATLSNTNGSSAGAMKNINSDVFL